MNPQLYDQLICDKTRKSIEWEQMLLGKLDSSMEKKETGLLSYTVHKNKLKMD